MPLDYFIEPRRADMLASTILRERLDAVKPPRPAASGEQAFFYDWTPPDGHAPLVYEVKDGTAIINVAGALASAQIPSWWWHADITYENVVAAVRDAVLRDDVDCILMSYYSPGGTVTGCAEAASQLDKLASQKPIIAHCTMACSAAYWLASTANKIVVDPTGEVGSIGVIMAHVDISKMLEKFGYDITLIFSGDRKGDGWPYDPLSEEAKERFQEDVDYLRAEFVNGVAAYRGIDKQAVHDTQALTYKGRQGIDIGLADEIAFLGDTITTVAGLAHADTPSQPTQSTKAKEKTMAKKKLIEKEEAKKRKPRARAADPKDDDKKDGAVEDDEDENAENPDDEENGTDRDEDEDAEDHHDDEDAEGDDEDEDAEDTDDEEESEEDEDKESARNPKARIKAIIQSKQAKGRRALAEHLAFNTDLSVKAAKETLKASPRSGKSNSGNGFLGAMRKQGNPDVGVDASGKKVKNPVANALAAKFGDKYARK